MKFIVTISSPREYGGTDRYSNLMILHKDIHTLVHAKRGETIAHYLSFLNLNANMIAKVNDLRSKAGLSQI